MKIKINWRGLGKKALGLLKSVATVFVQEKLTDMVEKKTDDPDKDK